MLSRTCLSDFLQFDSPRNEVGQADLSGLLQLRIETVNLSVVCADLRAKSNVSTASAILAEQSERYLLRLAPARRALSICSAAFGMGPGALVSGHFSDAVRSVEW